MAERQSHGLNFENFIIEKLKIEKNDNYTGEWDGWLDNTPVSIKTEKQGTDIELADFFRQEKILQDFYLIVGFWNNNKNNIIEVKALKINGKEYHSLFDEKYVLILKELLATITNRREDDLLWRRRVKVIKDNWKSDTSNLIRLRFKRDHKRQKRIQCAINNKDFFNYFLKKV